MEAPAPLLSFAERLSRRRLRIDPGGRQDPAVIAALAAAAYTPLRAQLAVFLGEQGFEALWWRAVALTRRQFPDWADAADVAESPLPPGLSAGLSGADMAEAHRRLIAAFAGFIGLLFSVIGADLGSHLIYQAWSDLPPDAAEPHTDGATP
ncbi:hypothetical protein K2Z83_11705 [Oscillochloris sp. ZM17-4]|uniref:hypothetical protein n=1 Tax=Oscillochloris sp. ZM17-4 TaxID=2866714 RepID=UPI001C73CDE4|nr:hypothetical protein [Oscillochloris sp. ZM17-4]MBX0328341.1 hypothetical protein [Oscillochloris sp. ZM17-4]